MIFLISFVCTLVWLVGFIATFRHFGYSVNEHMLNTHNKYYCHTCTCSVCGKSGWNKTSLCSGGHWEGFHVWYAGILGGTTALFFWPIIALGYGIQCLGVKAGGTDSFFAPAPKLLSREQKQQIKTDKLEKRIDELEKANHIS